MKEKDFERKRCYYCGDWTDYDGEGMIKLDENPICSDCFKEKTEEVIEEK